MLFHGLYQQEGGAYIKQLGCDLVDPRFGCGKKGLAVAAKQPQYTTKCILP